jgi:hypothetical protein
MRLNALCLIGALTVVAIQLSANAPRREGIE